MPTTVRAATAHDGAAVAELARGLNAQEGDPTEHFDAAAFVRHGVGDRPAFETLVAEVDGRIVGYALFHDSWDTAHAVRGVYLGDVFVRPEARRAGVGRALLAGVARAARARDARFVWWTAKPGNRAALAFYARLGARSEPVVAHALAWGAFERLADEGAAVGPRS